MIDGKSDQQGWVSYTWLGTNESDKYRKKDWTIFAYWIGQPQIFALNVDEFCNGDDKSLQLSQYTDANANIAMWPKEFYNEIIQLKNS